MRRLGLIAQDVTDEDGVAAVMEARRASHGSDFLPIYMHRIWVIGCAFRDQDGLRVRCLGDHHGIDDAHETARIRAFFRTIDKHTPQLVSWNGSGFDAPVLHHRAMVQSVAAPRYWDQGDDDRDFRYNNYLSRYHTRHLDLMDVLSAFQSRAAAPLDAVSRLCGFAGKLGEDGSQVWQAWRDGRGESVRAYCETDVVNTYLLFCRFRLLRGELSDQAYREELALVRRSLEAMIGDASCPLQGEHWQRYIAGSPALS
jgi:predicted PolB exonuclease-like 3'-5' exonuclease